MFGCGVSLVLGLAFNNHSTGVASKDAVWADDQANRGQRSLAASATRKRWALAYRTCSLVVMSVPRAVDLSRFAASSPSLLQALAQPDRHG